MSRRFALPLALLAACAASLPAQTPRKERPLRPAQRIRAEEGTLRVGDPAPDFTLRVLGDNKKTVALSSFRGKRPVYLVFASYTLPSFRDEVGSLEAVHTQYGDRAAFLLVYIREAHPVGGRTMKVNDRDGIRVRDPATTKEREAIAADCVKALRLSIPCLVDGVDDAVGKAYAAWPDRIYVVDAEGTIAYKGGTGPKGFRPREAEKTLRRLLGVAEGVPFAADADDETGLEPFHARVALLVKGADVDRSGALDRDEFFVCGPRIRHAFFELAPRKARTNRRDEMLGNEAMLGKYDKDGDRRLSLEERKAMEEDERAELTGIFRKADADGDGALPEAEVRAALPHLLGPRYRDVLHDAK